MPRFIDDILYETLSKANVKKGIKGYPFFYILILFIILLSFDMLFKLLNYGVFFNADIIHVLLFDLTWSIIIIFLVLLLPRFMRKFTLVTLVFFLSLVSIGESLSNDLTYGVSSLLNTFDYSDTVKTIPNYIEEFSIVYLAFFIPVLVFILCIYKIRLKSSFKKRFIILVTGIFMVLGTSLYTSHPLFNNTVENNTNYDKFMFFEELDLVASRLGITTFTIRNISEVFTNNIYNLDVDVNPLTQLESYLDKDKSKNNYSNILAGKNLIMIQVNNLDYLALNNNVMPTLNRFKNEGLFFENFYSTYSVENGDTEFAVQTGIIPTDKINNQRKFMGNSFPDSMGYLFKELGYSTFTIFDESDEYNIRTSFYLNGGYAVRNAEDLQNNGWKSNYETIENTTHYFLNEPRFFVNYVLSDTKYSLDNPVINKYYQDFSDFDVDEKIKYYYAACKDLDKALDSLLINLTKSNRINNTVIIVYGTHSSMFEDEKSQILDFDRNRLNIYNTPFILWTPSGNHISTQEYISPIDILPTLTNMFGLHANYENFIGNDVFSDSNTVYFKNRSWVNNVGEYNSITQEFTLTDKKYMTDFLKIYIKNTNEIIEEKFTFSRLILERNYFIQVKV